MATEDAGCASFDDEFEWATDETPEPSSATANLLTLTPGEETDYVTGSAPIWSAKEISRLAIIEKHYDAICQEMEQLLKSDEVFADFHRPKALWTDHENIQRFAEQVRTHDAWFAAWENEQNVSQKWFNFGLVFYDEPITKRCPVTVSVLRQLDGIRIAGFSLFEPGAVIPWHTDATGLTYGSLAYHLGLDVPTDAPSWLEVQHSSTVCRVMEENRKAFIFDPTSKHRACNSSAKRRCILYIDFEVTEEEIAHFDMLQMTCAMKYGRRNRPLDLVL
eukprot:m.152887 g.152887  ORF g.152887 m.152887 type:complete len:276 (-) comp16925_c0_seq2:142-969(-)